MAWRSPVDLSKKCRLAGSAASLTASPLRRTTRGGRRATTAVPPTSSDTSVSEPSGSTTLAVPSTSGAPTVVPHQVLGPHAQQQVFGGPAGGGQRARRQQVHRRRADEARDEGRGRPVVDVLGRADLLDAAMVQDDDAVRQRHRLDLVVRDVDRGRGHALAQALDLGAHLHAQLGIEVGKRLVEQEHLGIAHDGAAHGDALALAARELARHARDVGLDVEDARRLVDAAADLLAVDAAVAQRERHVLEHRHVRVERVVLEHHGDVPVLGIELVDDTAIDGDLAGGDVLQPGDHAQQRALAAARGADEDDELAVGDFEVDAMHDLDLAERLFHAAKAEARHVFVPPRAKR